MATHDNNIIPRHALALVSAERYRQVAEEGWTLNMDRKVNSNLELARGALCYLAVDRTFSVDIMSMPEDWPWERRWWKPRAQNGPEGRASEIIRGAGLLCAEWDRLQGEAFSSLKALKTTTVTLDVLRPDSHCWLLAAENYIRMHLRVREGYAPWVLTAAAMATTALGLFLEENPGINL